MPSYEEEANILVNNLVSQSAPEGKKDAARTQDTEEDKTAEDKSKIIVITDKDDLDSDSNSDHFY